MNWNDLLSAKRSREIETGQPTKPVSNREARTEFDRDYDRSVFSSPVRRLQDKAQVWPLERNDFVRTRLTHSLEVSAVARGIARRVAHELRARDEIDDEQAHSIQMVAATCGLLHDLGNPPFGHAGEEALRQWFTNKLVPGSNIVAALAADSSYVQDFLRFDGNPQTFRLVAHLQMLADLSGLNLTAATLSALMKYTAASNTTAGIHPQAKPGYFASEAELVEKIRELLGTGLARHPIALLVEASDDIVYSAVDIEDGLRKGALSWRKLQERLLEEAPTINSFLSDLQEKSSAYIERGGLNLRDTHRDEALVQIFRTYAIAKNVEAAADAFLENYASIMDGTFHSELVKSGSTAAFVAACKQVGRKDVYVAKSILRLEVMGRRVITDLCDLFWEGAQHAPNPPIGFEAKLYGILSTNYRKIFESQIQSGMPEEYCQLQLVADYLSGMTDTFAADLHKQLFNG